MNIEELNDKFEKFGNIWEQFQQVNNDRLLQLERKGSVDPLTEIKLDNLNKAIEEQKSKINTLEISMSRPMSGNEEYKSAEDMQYKSALNNYLKRGIEEQIANIEVKRDLTTSMDSVTAYGGYLLTPNIQKMIMDKVEDRCIMRKICSVQEISSPSLDVLDGSGATPSWLCDNGTVTDADTSISTKKTITAYDLVAQPKVSQRLLDDAAIDIEEWLSDRLAGDFANAEEEAFISGTGSTGNQPNGILNYSNEEGGIEAITSADTKLRFNENDILDLYYSLGDRYVNNASFLMPRSAMKQIRMLKDATSGRYLWNPALLSGQTDTLLGCPIYQSSYVPAVGKSTKSIIFGDFKYYQIIDRIGIRILRDPFTSKPYVRFYTTKRVGGDVVDLNAFKVLITAGF